MGSADWMPRNLDRRVEIMFPIESEALRQEVMHILDLQFRDNVKTHILMPEGDYHKMESPSEERLSCQEVFCQEAKARAKRIEKSFFIFPYSFILH
jgi:polyphosphate kinase